MDATLVVTHSGSTLAGRRQRFAQPVVTLGRRPDNDVVFDRAGDPLVSGRHAEVRVSARGLDVCDVGSTNGTFVNGRRLAAGRPTPVNADDEVRLGGAEGPRVYLVREAAASGGDLTRPQALYGEPHADPFSFEAERPAAARRRIGEKTHLQGILDAVRRERRRGLATSVGVLAVCACVGIGVWIGGTRAAGAPVALPEPKPLPATPPTTTDPAVIVATPSARIPADKEPAPTKTAESAPVVAKESAPPSRPTSDAPVAAKPPVAPPVATQVAPPAAPASGPVPSDAQRLSTALNAAQSSVFVVIRKTTRKGETELNPIGTAWSCAPGVLATNAHVAASFRGKGPDDEFIARNGSDPSRDLRLTAERTHPGYDAFRELWVRYSGGLQCEPFNAIKGACDVALFTVHEEDRKRQPPPLTLADDAHLRTLRSTDEIGFVGFSMEGRGLNVARPSSLAVTGRITGLVDPFLGSASFEERLLLAFDAQGGGGASGSPVFDATGLVVGILFAGDAQVGNGGRVNTAGGQTYAQRIDLVRELLSDGSGAAGPRAERSEKWEAQFRDLYASARKSVVEAALTCASASLGKSLQNPAVAGGGAAIWEEVDAKDLKIETSTASGAKPFRFDVAQRGVYCVVVVPVDEAKSVRLVESFNPTWTPFFDFEWFQATSPAGFSRRLFADGASRRAPVDVRVVLYRLRQ